MAIDQCAREKKKNLGDAITLEDLKPYLRNQTIPQCPYGGSYIVNVVGAIPTCSFTTNDPNRKIRFNYFHYVTTTPGHVLP